MGYNICDHLGPVVQSIVSLTSSLVVKMLTVLVSTISYSQVFLLNKFEFLFQNINIYAIFNDQSFNDTLTKDTASFEQLGPDLFRAHNAPSRIGFTVKSKPCFRKEAN